MVRMNQNGKETRFVAGLAPRTGSLRVLPAGDEKRRRSNEYEF